MGKNPAITGFADEAPLAMAPVAAQQRLLDVVSGSLPEGPSWQGGLSRRRLLQVSLLTAAAAGLAGVLPRALPTGKIQPDAPKPFESAIEEQLERQVAMDLVPKRKPAVPASFVDRKLSLYNENTGESVTATYWSHGGYVLEELESIHWLLRDHHVDEMHAIDLKLVELLHAIGSRLEVTEPLHILSAYRTPRTNAKLAERYDGVALHSFHMKGQAADLYVPGRRKRDILKIARAMKAGGVGSYSRYVHLDTGPPRSW
ncbi:MAG: YcbK family protein [Kiloniellales bacterium]